MAIFFSVTTKISNPINFQPFSFSILYGIYKSFFDYLALPLSFDFLYILYNRCHFDSINIRSGSKGFPLCVCVCVYELDPKNNMFDVCACITDQRLSAVNICAEHIANRNSMSNGGSFCSTKHSHTQNRIFIKVRTVGICIALIQLINGHARMTRKG